MRRNLPKTPNPYPNNPTGYPYTGDCSQAPLPGPVRPSLVGCPSFEGVQIRNPVFIEHETVSRLGQYSLRKI